ncbi:MAG: helix-turn-helix transcriptional regulator, partial [Lentisphaeria bacterium]|nr:helix-turn-helix transcriptional regulator [Lentisphaeria bacterium]
MKWGNLKLVSSFRCDPAIEKRHATDADRQCRSIGRHPDRRGVVIALDGECDMLLKNRIYRIYPGCALLIGNGEEHQEYYPAGTPPVRQLCMLLLPEHLIYHLDTVTDSGYRDDHKISGFRHYCPHDYAELIAAWDRAAEHPDREVYLTELSLLIQLQAVRLFRILPEIEEFDSFNSEKKNRLHIDQVMEYIDRQCGRDCSISTLAHLAGYSRTHFIRNFRRYAGCSVLEYVNRQRILRYRSLLKPSSSTD